MKFEEQIRYRFKAVDIQIEQIETTGNVLVEMLLEVTLGPLLGRRIKWTGWLNSDENAKRAIAEVRATGWSGAALGELPFGKKPSEWPGFASAEVEGEVRYDEVEVDVDGKLEVRRYPRACFLRPIPELTARNPVGREAIAGLSRRFGALLRNGTAPGAGARPPTREETRDAAALDIPPAPEMKQDEIPF